MIQPSIFYIVYDTFISASLNMIWKLFWRSLDAYFFFQYCFFHSFKITLRFFSNLFHGQIIIYQLSDPENKKCSPWKVFGTNHPQTLQLLSKRGPRCLEARLSQYDIGPKLTFCHFSNFCTKKFSGLTKMFLQICWQKSCGKTSTFIQ